MTSRQRLAPAIAWLVAASCTGTPKERTPADSASTVGDSARRAAEGLQPAAATPPPDSGRASVPGTTTPARRDSTPTSTPTPTPSATPSETVLTGKVVAGGVAAQPVTSLQVEGGRPTTLTGPLEPELRRLGGATVWVAGAPGGGMPNASFTVSRYEIVSIDGAKPMVGSLMTRGGATWLAAERDTIKLVAATPELTAKVGAKVWIVGRRAGAELTPQSFGVIRDP